jgi:acid phosphatase type 7
MWLLWLSAAVLLLAGTSAVAHVPQPSRPGTRTAPVGVLRVVAAGDLCGDCGRTARRARALRPEVVVTLGDLAYENGLMSEFRQKYGGGTRPQTRWGRRALKRVTLPGYGNHDCYDVPRLTGATKQGCEDAVRYFGRDGRFGTDIPGTPGSYWTVRGGWLIVQLNSAGGQGSGEATPAEMASQNAALRQILDRDRHRCEVVAWHHPRYSSGEHGNQGFVDPWFESAFAGGVDIALSGHDHEYERFAPQDGDSRAVRNGVRQFVVGTGGAAPRPFRLLRAHSMRRISDKGVLLLRLRSDRTYRWRFVDDRTGAFDDAGRGRCHG